jgi:hypothetical protein
MPKHPGEVIEAAELARRAMQDRSAFIRATRERVRPQIYHFPLYDDGSVPVWKVRTGFRLLEQTLPWSPLQKRGVTQCCANCGIWTG